MRGLAALVVATGCAEPEPQSGNWLAELAAATPTGSAVEIPYTFGWTETWDAATSTCLPVDLPREPCEPAQDRPLPGPGTQPCTARADCGVDEFCGLGYCRPDTELVTVCVHEASLAGPMREHDGTPFADPPDLYARWWSAAHGVFWVPTFTTEVIPNECAPIWHRCMIWRMKGAGGAELMVRSATASEVYAWYGPMWPGEDLRELVNTGCVVRPLRGSADLDDIRGNVVFSIHYP